jgi:hypothetical protein
MEIYEKESSFYKFLHLFKKKKVFIQKKDVHVVKDVI